MKFNDGSRYSGEWKDDQRHGEGELTHHNPHILGVVLIKNHLGVFHYVDGAKYIGLFSTMVAYAENVN